MITRFSRVRIQIGLGMMLSVLFAAGIAQARTETLVWDYSASATIEFAGFEVLSGPSSRNYTQVIDVGMSPLSGGAHSYDLSVADDATVYIAVRAYALDGSSSALSNERVRSAPGSSSPPPSEPPPSEPSPLPTAAAPAAFSPAGDLVIDFENSPVGQAVLGWVDTNPENSMVVNDALFEIVDISGNRVLSTRSTLRNIHSHYTNGGSENWSGYELRGAMMISDPSGGIGVTVHSDYPNSDSYYRLRSHTNGSFEIVPHTTGFSCANVNTGVVPQAGVWYRFSIRVDRNALDNRVRAKVWRDGMTEPTSAQVDCTDSSGSRPTSGKIGVWAMGPGTKYWDILDVSGIDVSASAGSPPAPPLLIDIIPVVP